MKKRILSLCLALALLLCLLPAAFAAAPAESHAGNVAINATNFPDSAFRSYVAAEFDTDVNGVLSASEIAAATEISAGSKNISNLKGVEYFTSLTSLSCSYNQLTKLDVSHNSKLESLNCSDNKIEELILGSQANLSTLEAYNNKMRVLDIRGCPKLILIYNTGEMVIEGDQAFEGYYYYEWDRSGVGTLVVDVRTRLLLDGAHILIDFPDANFREIVKQYDTNSNDFLSESELAAVTVMSCANRNIADLKGIEHFTALTELYCSGNQLTSLDLSKNVALTILSCDTNQMTTLDLSKNTALTQLYCNGNRLTSLDVSKNTALTDLYCYGNQLTSLDLSKVSVLKDAVVNGKKNTGDSKFDWYSSSLGNLYVDKLVTIITKSNIVNPFTDVKESDYYYDSVLWAVEKKVTAGTSATTFSPSEDCTRAQVVTFLWRAAGSPEPKTTNNPFQDVREKDYFYKAVLWAVENGITSGTSKTRFSPNESCTRAQVVTFLWRYEKQEEPKSTSNPFNDVKADAYYYKAVLWAVENGVTAGTGKTTFSPDDTCTRGQIVTFLYRDLAGK